MSKRVVIIDDEQNLVDLMELQLQDAGYETVCFLDAKQALTYILDNQVDAIVSDMQMPGGSGLELIRQVKESKPNLPTVVISGFAAQQHDIKGSGVSRLLQKPLELAKVAETVDELLVEKVA